MADLEIIEHHPQRVMEAFRRGEFDQLEIVGEADEKEFFELCLREKILQVLAESMPTVRKKIEVPLWFQLAANLSLKLHQENSYAAFEQVAQGGGLLSALPPELASKHLDPRTQAIWIECVGFNQKNHYPRKMPCDDDTLRKAVRDVPAADWQSWFNGAVQQVFQRYGFFDPAGIFIGDGSYLFVPDNPAYENSVVLWFDEHNHPVKYAELSAAERKKAHRERCYKLVSLVHVRGDAYVYVALAVVPGNAHEDPVLYQLVADFVQAVGKGVMKRLILDRGFIDGPNMTRCKKEWDIDVLIPMKKKMDIWADAWALGQKAPWQTSAPPVAPPAPPAPHRPEVMVRRQAQRQATLKAKRPAPDPAQVLQARESCWIEGFNSGSEAQVPIHVLLLRERSADGHGDEWGLMTTRLYREIQQPREDYQLRPKIEERHRLLKCFHDLSDFRSRQFNTMVAQVVFILLSYTLRQWQLWKWHREEWAGVTPGLMHRRLNVRQEYVVIYLAHAYARLPLLRFTREVLELEPKARAKALAKIRKLEPSLLTPMDNTS
jgi:hypothetical protein